MAVVSIPHRRAATACVMRERAKAIGASLNIASQPGHTVVEISLPV